MTLNGEMALILHYFTEFVSTLIVYDHINTICPLIQHYLGKTNSDNSV